MYVLFNFFPPSLCGLRQSFCPSGTLCESANVFILYPRIYINIILVFCLKMQSFCLFVPYLKLFPSVAKEVGCYPKGTLRRGQSPKNILIFNCFGKEY